MKKYFSFVIVLFGSLLPAKQVVADFLQYNLEIDGISILESSPDKNFTVMLSELESRDGDIITGNMKSILFYYYSSQSERLTLFSYKLCDKNGLLFDKTATMKPEKEAITMVQAYGADFAPISVTIGPVTIGHKLDKSAIYAYRAGPASLIMTSLPFPWRFDLGILKYLFETNLNEKTDNPILKRISNNELMVFSLKHKSSKALIVYDCKLQNVINFIKLNDSISWFVTDARNDNDYLITLDLNDKKIAQIKRYSIPWEGWHGVGHCFLRSPTETKQTKANTMSPAADKINKSKTNDFPLFVLPQAPPPCCHSKNQ